MKPSDLERAMSELERLTGKPATLGPFRPQAPPAKPQQAWRAVFRACAGCKAVRAAVTRAFRR